MDKSQALATKFNFKDAHELASKLQRDDPDWFYFMEHLGDSIYIVGVNEDKDAEHFIGYF